jgi:hypothetical protein
MIRKLNGFTLVATMLLLTGCGDLLSLHSLYTAQDQVFDAAMEGRWENEDNQLLVERQGGFYNVTLVSKKNPSDSTKYEVHLVDINGVRFADILVVDTIGHMFLRVRVTDGQLSLAFFDSQWLRQRVSHEGAEVEQGKTRAVLTARTSQLRKTVARFVHDARSYDPKELVFRRSTVAGLAGFLRCHGRDFLSSSIFEVESGPSRTVSSRAAPSHSSFR